MKIGLLTIAALGLALTLPTAASAQYSQDFDSYATGTDMHGVDGWKGWDGNGAFTAFTSADQANSAPNSLAVGPTSDLVREFSGYDSGMWVVTVWQYIPSTVVGQQYVLLLNEYADGGPYNWSTQIQFNEGIVTNDGDGSIASISYDRWVEVRIEIDFTTDVQTIYYDGSVLTLTSWTEGLSGGGALNFGALDLFSNGASNVYYDDITVESGNPTPVIDSSWGEVKNKFK